MTEHKATHTHTHTIRYHITLYAGELVLQQTAISLLSAIALAEPKELVGITAGLTELRHFGYLIADEQLQQIYNRKDQLAATR